MTETESRMVGTAADVQFPEAEEERGKLSLSQLPNGEWSLDEDGLSISGPYKNRERAQLELEQRMAKERDAVERKEEKSLSVLKRIGKSDTGGDVYRLGEV